MKPKQRSVKKYSLPVHCSDEFAEVPTRARFSITRSKAREIVRLSEIVKSNVLLGVERFDYSVRYDRADIQTDVNCLHVGKNDFHFSAMVRHTGTSFETEYGSIPALVKYFGL